MNIEVTQDIIKILGVEQHIVPITEVDMALTQEVIRGIEEIIIMGSGYRDQSYSRGQNRSFERQNRSRRDDRSESNSRSRSGSRASTNRDRIQCFKCREYDHFA